jgi:hypothetical protein
MKNNQEKKAYVAPAFRVQNLRHQANLLQDSGKKGYGGLYSMIDCPKDNWT